MFNKNNIGKIVLYLVATVFIAYGAGTAMLMSFTKGDFKSINTSNTATVDQEKLESLNSIKEIYVEVSSAKVNIITENRKDVKARLTGSITSSSKTNEPTLETSVAGTKLNINVRSQNTSVGFALYRSMNLQLDIYVPSDYASDLRIKSSSGDINISEAKLNNLSCTLSSGKLNLGKISADNFNYDSSSGSLSASELITKSSDLEVSSGKIKLDRFEGDLKARASSGDINVRYGRFNNNVDVTISSGSVELTMPGDSEFKLAAKTSSGNVTCEFPITVTDKQKDRLLEGVVKNDKNRVSLTSSSGNIRVLK
jgi:lia operon protein LiaG